MSKSQQAFRTISEVSDELEVPAHVLRFWETKFPQIKPMKRGGGRRYYRPEDISLLKGVREMLHVEGYSIKGVQKALREQGPRAVADRADLLVGEQSILDQGLFGTQASAEGPKAPPRKAASARKPAASTKDKKALRDALDALVALRSKIANG